MLRYSAKRSSVGQGKILPHFITMYFKTAKNPLVILCLTYELAVMNFILAAFGFFYSQKIYRTMRRHSYQCVSDAFFPSLMYILLTRHCIMNYNTANTV